MKKLGFIMLLLVLAGCKRKGCTSSRAVNYDFNAGRDDASCLYEGSIVFWLNKTTASKLRAAGSDSLFLRLGGSAIGVLSVDNWSGTVPECGSARSLTYTEDLGSASARTYELKVHDEKGQILYQAVTELKGGFCIQQELGS